MGAKTQAHIEYFFILVIIVAPLGSTILMGLELNPDINFSLPFTYQMKIYIQLLWIVAGIFLALFWVEYSENAVKGARSQGFTVASSFSLVGSLIGFVMSAYLLLTDYSFSNPELNKWISYYLWIGAFTIFILARGFIFQHEAITARFK